MASQQMIATSLLTRRAGGLILARDDQQSLNDFIRIGRISSLPGRLTERSAAIPSSRSNRS
jgi:hypothetical protein